MQTPGRTRSRRRSRRVEFVSDPVLGLTVRKPATRATYGVHALLTHLTNVGFVGAPRSFGVDEQERHVLEYVPGTTADEDGPFDHADLTRLGELVRDLHDAAESFEPPPGVQWQVTIPVPAAPSGQTRSAASSGSSGSVAPSARSEIVCHHDISPWNLVRDGERWVLLDWDGAGPGGRVDELASVGQAFLPLQPGGDPHADGARLRSLVDGYGLTASQRPELVQATADHTRTVYELLVDGARTGEEPWASLHAAGHAERWESMSDYVHRHRGELRAALR
jgi:Ser/Thr protein kinase RdoA (MazF antagonist)